MVEENSHQHSANGSDQSNNANYKFTPRQLDAQKRREDNENHRMISMVFLSLLIDLLAFTMILPLLPSLLDYYAQHDQGGLLPVLRSRIDSFRDLLGIPDTHKYNSVLFGGVIGSLFSFLQFIASPVIGAASDVYGRRPLMLLTMTGITISYCIWAVSHNFTLFVIARIIGGISKGNVSLSTTIVTDVSTATTRGKGMALIGIAFSLGFIMGPMIGAYFAMSSGGKGEALYFKPALFAITLAVADIIFIFLFFKETLPTNKRAGSLGSSFKDACDLISPLSLFLFSAVKKLKPSELQMLRLLGVCYFLYLFLFSGLEFTLTFLVHRRFQYTSMQQGKMFVFIGAFMALVQGGCVRRIRPGKEKRVAVIGIVVLIPSFIIIGYAQSIALLYIGLALFSFAAGTVVSCMTTVVSAYGTADQKGTIMGIFRSLGALARALGPIFASVWFWSMGPTICYAMGGVLLILPLIGLSRVVPLKLEH
ncbi:major facilitator superfamily domain-containing protein 10-like [Patiria miniata]|uniref:Major facilitator superfamily (MFS) profile domain-containing protein n=1 Tax=Patiria miniata TaxID=46514 RepID=A0A914B5H8_PATMI|nr:major facilitator superfamily domain-containing protein 10-like [Patiria miniata]XP_038071071.1 major facilitator superfamily domain-containing protein 10-like [Patiria miniata]